MASRRAYRLVCVSTVCSFVVAISSCGEKEILPPPVDADCVTPSVTDFRDSTVARVVIRQYNFHPAAITIRAGQTVKWKHCGPEPDGHTVTSDAGSSTVIDSPLLGLSAIFTKEFTVAGSNPYHCSPHPEMTGTVTVVASAPASPGT